VRESALRLLVSVSMEWNVAVVLFFEPVLSVRFVAKLCSGS